MPHNESKGRLAGEFPWAAGLTSKNDRRVEIIFTAAEKQRGDSTFSSDMDKTEEKKYDTVTVGLVMEYKL